MTAMRLVPAPTRGSGQVACEDPACRGHRERCLFGEMHTWSVWYENAKLQRTQGTFHCYRCGGVCIAEEDDWEPEVTDKLEALRAELIAKGYEASSPAVLSPEAEQIAIEEKWN